MFDTLGHCAATQQSNKSLQSDRCSVTSIIKWLLLRQCSSLIVVYVLSHSVDPM